ncbi:3-phosphoserine/phosphohydroxythreonine transaminase [Bacillus sp. JZ8]
MVRAHNFNAGPSALPLDVLKKAQEELIDFKGTGMSVMELSHRSKEFEDVLADAKDRLKKLMEIPDTHEILFLQGGASLQFSMLPMNFLQEGKVGAYVVTGSWSKKALKEAKNFGETVVVASTEDDSFTHIPEVSVNTLPENTGYLHITTNNTIYGTQWHDFPDFGDIPVFADMSSDILSKKVDVSKFAVIYGGAQKNLGPSGVTIVILRKDLLNQQNSGLPTMLDYTTHIKANSLFNTPPTFGIYMLSLVLEWVEQNGGVEGIQKRNEEKAALLYDLMDEFPEFYTPHARKDSRSLMNVTFTMPNEELTKDFLQKAKAEGFIGLNGHRSIGGCRASIYNAVPIETCQALAQFMKSYREAHLQSVK